jgi:hypothetical protein
MLKWYILAVNFWLTLINFISETNNMKIVFQSAYVTGVKNT